jgi:ribosome biogenesis GTPase
VFAAHGRRFLVHTPTQDDLECVTRGRKSDVVCGDVVALTLTSPGRGVIDSIRPRTSLFKRVDTFRTKSIAANVTQVAIVVAPRPSWSKELLQRCLLAAETQHLRALIIANKADLQEHPRMLDELSFYPDLGYPVISLSARIDVQPLIAHLKDHLTLLVGQSGMGKSTLVNSLFPDAMAAVNAFSKALDGGRHTTTHSRLYSFDEHSAVIDSPGLQEFALTHLSRDDIESAMPDFRPYLGQCRFRDCRHQHEPDCAIRKAVDAGGIAPQRLGFFQRLLSENTSRSSI